MHCDNKLLIQRTVESRTPEPAHTIQHFCLSSNGRLHVGRIIGKDILISAPLRLCG
jgi:hypothetical protein